MPPVALFQLAPTVQLIGFAATVPQQYSPRPSHPSVLQDRTAICKSGRHERTVWWRLSKILLEKKRRRIIPNSTKLKWEFFFLILAKATYILFVLPLFFFLIKLSWKVGFETLNVCSDLPGSSKQQAEQAGKQNPHNYHLFVLFTFFFWL